MGMAGDGNLRPANTSFVGRRQALAEVHRGLDASRLLTLTGAGGIGKTRLALAAAEGRAEHFPGGVWLVDLTSVRDPAGVTAATATALGLVDLGVRPVLEQLIGHLTTRRALLILDNCEHLVDACAQLAGTLLSTAADLHILATSRRVLDAMGERVITVPPLSPAEAAELLRDRTSAIGAGHRLDEADEAQVTRLCAGLEGLPLAIELAASQLRQVSVEQATERLEDRFALLSDGSGISMSQGRTLRTAIDWSYQLCTPGEQLLWNRLSVFAGDFSLEAAEDVCAGDGLARHEILDLLDGLVSQSVVLVGERDGLPRYRLLEAIRQYGWERLAECGETGQLVRRHRGFLLALAGRTEAGWFGPGQEQGLARLRAEHGNLLAALDPSRVTRPGDAQDGLALTAALGFHWCCNGFVSEGRRQLEEALAVAPEPTQARAEALWTAAWVTQVQGALDVADRLLDEADDLGERLADPRIRAYVQGLRGTLALYRGRPQDAVPLFEGAVAAQAALDGEPATLRWLFQLALAQLYLGDPRAAETAGRAVATAEAHGERLTRAYALWVLGYGAWLRGSPRESAALMRACLEMHQSFHDHAGVAMALEVLAWSTAALGDHERAARLLGVLRPLARELSPTGGGPFAEPHARCEKTITDALGPDAYARALAEGASHDTPYRAVAFALSPVDTAGQGSSGALTRKEREVAVCVAQGMTNRQISVTLGRSPRTVDGHVKNIMAKLGFVCPTQVVTWWEANESAACERAEA